MRAIAATGIAALVLCAPALAKFEVSVGASDTTPGVGQKVTVVVRSERPLDYNLRLMAVAPGKNVFKVVATITGDTSHPDPNIAHNGFEVRLTRMAADRWRGTVRFRSPGRWRLVVPERRSGRGHDAGRDRSAHCRRSLVAPAADTASVATGSPPPVDELGLVGLRWARGDGDARSRVRAASGQRSSAVLQVGQAQQRRVEVHQSSCGGAPARGRRPTAPRQARPSVSRRSRTGRRARARHRAGRCPARGQQARQAGSTWLRWRVGSG